MEELRQTQSSQKKYDYTRHVGRRALSKLRAGLPHAGGCCELLRPPNLPPLQHYNIAKLLSYIPLSASTGEAVCQLQLDSLPRQKSSHVHVSEVRG